MFGQIGCACVSGALSFFPSRLFWIFRWCLSYLCATETKASYVCRGAEKCRTYPIPVPHNRRFRYFHPLRRITYSRIHSVFWHGIFHFAYQIWTGKNVNTFEHICLRIRIPPADKKGSALILTGDGTCLSILSKYNCSKEIRFSWTQRVAQKQWRKKDE